MRKISKATGIIEYRIGNYLKFERDFVFYLAYDAIPITTGIGCLHLFAPVIRQLIEKEELRSKHFPIQKV